MPFGYTAYYDVSRLWN